MPGDPRAPDAQWLWDNEPCRAACPVHTDAGAYVTAIAQGRFRDAYLLAVGSEPVRVNLWPRLRRPLRDGVPARHGRRGDLDPCPQTLRDRTLRRRELRRQLGMARGTRPGTTRDWPVGGGDRWRAGGLAAAHDLRLAGHPVTIYEANERLGGMMVLGIPEYRLSREVIAREVDAILELGVDARGGFRVGIDASLTELLDRHGALFLAVGTGRARSLDLPGHDLDGVFRAIEYLLNVNHGFQVDLGERVVVVGGGNVAFDAHAPRCAWRSTARQRSPQPVRAPRSRTHAAP